MTATTKTTKTRAKGSNFARGSGVYTCRCCKRSTRATGRGDNDHVLLCGECYDLAGEENYLSDNGKFYAGPASVLELVGAVRIKGGNTSRWAEIEARARKEAGLDPVEAPAAAPAPAPFTEVKVVLRTDAGEVTTAYPIADKVKALVLASSYMAENKSFSVTYA